MTENDARDLATAVLAYSAAIDAAQDDPGSMTSARTVQGDDLDTCYERMHQLACKVLGMPADVALRSIQQRRAS